MVPGVTSPSIKVQDKECYRILFGLQFFEVKLLQARSVVSEMEM